MSDLTRFGTALLSYLVVGSLGWMISPPPFKGIRHWPSSAMLQLLLIPSGASQHHHLRAHLNENLRIAFCACLINRAISAADKAQRLQLRPRGPSRPPPLARSAPIRGLNALERTVPSSSSLLSLSAARAAFDRRRFWFQSYHFC